MSERGAKNIRATVVTLLTIAMAVVSYLLIIAPNIKKLTSYSYKSIEVQLQEHLIALNNVSLLEDPPETLNWEIVDHGIISDTIGNTVRFVILAILMRNPLGHQICHQMGVK